MSSGRVHRKVTLYVGVPFVFLTMACGSYAVSDPWPVVVATVGCMSGMVLTPDLDQGIIDSIEWKMMKYSGGLLSPWLGLWMPYAVMIPHRHPLSHFPVLSTLVRLMWLAWHPFAWLSMIALGLSVEQMIFWPAALLGWFYFGAFFFGLCVSDGLHWLMDGMPMVGFKRG